MLVGSAMDKRSSALLRLLDKAGIELDTRQDKYPLIFAVFPISDSGANFKVGELALEMKEFFIANGEHIPFDSKIKQITFSPLISEIGPPTRGASISYLPKQKAIHIKYGYDPNEWKKANRRARKKMLFDGLFAAIKLVRPTWLREEDRDRLAQIFAGFAGIKI
jgi:hypothetical protein